MFADVGEQNWRALYVSREGLEEAHRMLDAWAESWRDLVGGARATRACVAKDACGWHAAIHRASLPSRRSCGSQPQRSK
eukprot:scaffold12761_cov112-Isochrysis_galbana.AAC.1